MKNETMEATAATIAKNVGFAGSGSAVVLGGLGISEIAAIAGIVVGVLGLAVQVYFKRKEDQRSETLYRARMAGLIVKDDA